MENPRESVVRTAPHAQRELPPKTGWLEVFSESGFLAAASWKKRWVVMRNKQLVIYKRKQEDAPADKPLVVMDLESCNVKQYASKRKLNCFQISHPIKSDIILGAASEQEMVEWMRAVQAELTMGITHSLDKITTSEIHPSDLEFTNEVIGKGGSGLVKKGIWLKSIPVAIKTLNNIPEFIEEEELEGFFNEMAILSEMRHPNVVSFYGFSRKDNYICLVTEYVTGGDLSSCLRDKTRSMSPALKLELALNISAAMIYLHGKNLIHRDLKPGNILIEDWELGKVKVCDFGLSRIKKPDDVTMTIDMFGSPAYAAPELNSAQHTNKVDVFSYAIILWEIDTRQTAWPKYDKAWLITDAIQRGERMEVSPGSPFGSLIMRCWDQDAEKRPGFIDTFNELQEMKTSKKLGALPVRQASGGTLTATGGAGAVTPANGQPPAVGAKRVFPPNTSPGIQHNHSVRQLPTSAIPLPVQNDPGQKILAAFKQALPWDQFVRLYKDNMGNPPDNSVNQLKFVLTDSTEVVTKQRFDTFLKWFSPLIPDDNSTYGNASSFLQKTGQTNTGGYSTAQIAAIVGPPWFHGWLSAEESKAAIGSSPEGTFLFRFSQSPRCYSLSVMHLGQVVHWRITSSKNSDSDEAMFKIDSRDYRSIRNIVDVHSVEPLKVFQLLSTGKEDVFLKKELPRGDTEGNYANVPRAV